MRIRTCSCNECPKCLAMFRAREYRDRKRNGRPGVNGRPKRKKDAVALAEWIARLREITPGTMYRLKAIANECKVSVPEIAVIARMFPHLKVVVTPKGNAGYCHCNPEWFDKMKELYSVQNQQDSGEEEQNVQIVEENA